MGGIQTQIHPLKLMIMTKFDPLMSMGLLSVKLSWLSPYLSSPSTVAAIIGYYCKWWWRWYRATGVWINMDKNISDNILIIKKDSMENEYQRCSIIYNN